MTTRTGTEDKQHYQNSFKNSNLQVVWRGSRSCPINSARRHIRDLSLWLVIIGGRPNKRYQNGMNSCLTNGARRGQSNPTEFSDRHCYG